MSLLPDINELLARARADLRMGVPVVLSDGLVVLAVETLTAERFEDVRRLGPAPVVAITGWRAQTLKARAYDGDIARISLPEGATRTWVQSIADPAGDLDHPMKGPLMSLREGAAGPHRAAIALIKDARLLPAAISVEIEDPAGFAAAHNLTLVSMAAIIKDGRPELLRTIHARLPMDVSDAGRLHIFRPDDGGEDHFAVEIGSPDRDAPVLTRLHSACFTGDVLGSAIGLANKMRAYSLQDQGFDTVEANHRLGFEDDERDFRIGAEILRGMGFSKIRLMTNNPRKVEMLSACGLDVVERVPLKVGETSHNRAYLATKAAKSGHLL